MAAEETTPQAPSAANAAAQTRGSVKKHKKKKKKDRDTEAQAPLWQRALHNILMLGVIVLAVFSARWSLADHYEVPTGSMRPTVAIEDRILVNKLAYGLRLPFTSWELLDFGDPQRGDVVVLDSPEADRTLLKRVVGLPGDTIAVVGGHVHLNGEPVRFEASADDLFSETLGALPHTIRVTRAGAPDYPARQIPNDHFLVLGDNRGESHDGRFFGLVHRDAIFGKAFGVYMRDGSFTWQDL